jgi:hypothetical protein
LTEDPGKFLNHNKWLVTLSDKVSQ